MKHLRSGVAAVLSAVLGLLGSFGPVQAAEDTPPMSTRTSGLKVATIPVEGLVCVSCAASIKRAVKKVDGVTDVELDFVDRSLRVTYAPSRTLLLGQVTAAIDDLGFKAGTPVLEP